MERELARHVIEVSFHSSRLLEDLVPLLVNQCKKEESEQFTKAIASVLAEINIELLTKIYAQYPDLKNEVNEKIQKYGRFI
jgi:hypothetical protein